MQCGKICQHGHYEVIVSLTSHEQKEATYQPHRGGGTDVAVLTTAGPMLAVWGLKTQKM